MRLILCFYRIDLGCRPGGVFHRARHYNVFAGSNRAETIETARKLLDHLRSGRRATLIQRSRAHALAAIDFVDIELVCVCRSYRRTIEAVLCDARALRLDGSRNSPARAGLAHRRRAST